MGVDIAFPTRTLYVRNENGQKFEMDLKSENGEEEGAEGNRRSSPEKSES